jgi:transcriptional regulator with XRE-family HTH domain
MSRKCPPEEAMTASEDGRRIISIRKAVGWSQAQLAEKMGMTEATISRWESGDRSPSWITARRLARVLGCPSAALEDDSALVDWMSTRPRSTGRE